MREKRKRRREEGSDECGERWRRGAEGVVSDSVRKYEVKGKEYREEMREKNQEVMSVYAFAVPEVNGEEER